MHTSITLIAFMQLLAPNTTNGLVSYPTLGYMLSARHLMRLAGIPGASYASPDSSSPAEYTQLRSASCARAILLATVSDSPTLLLRTPLAETTVSLADAPVDTAISPTGAYFAALFSSHLSLYRRSGAAAIASIDARTLPAPVDSISALLVGDDGDVVLNTNSALWYSADPTHRDPAFIMVPASLTFVRFAPRDHLLLAYDADKGRVVALHPTSGFAIEPLITAQDNLTGVTGLEFAADNLSIWVTQQAGDLLNYNLAHRFLTLYAVPPGSIASVTAPGVFSWSQPNQSIAILDTTRTPPAVLVVPIQAADAAK